MRRIVLTLGLIMAMFNESHACADYEADGDYFNLFTQSIIQDKSYLPFLLSYSNRFYDHTHYEIPDDNIIQWQKFFQNKISYDEAKKLVYQLSLDDLNRYKKGVTTHPILSKLGSYAQNSEAIDYLIQAKYMEPYMYIYFEETPDTFSYYYRDDHQKNVSLLNYDKIVNTLKSLYQASKHPEIKLRYGYQLVRFQHYYKKYEQAIADFKQYVAPLNLKTTPYYWALEQMAGAQAGLKMQNEANRNYFEVFMHSPIRRESAFISMKLTDESAFEKLLASAQTNEEKNMMYFLLAYDSFSNPLPQMQNIYDNDPNSELLKVLAARSINDLERTFLPVYFYKSEKIPSEKTSLQSTPAAETENKQSNDGFWNKVVNFFKSLFGNSSNGTASPERVANASDKTLLNHPNRLPYLHKGKDKDGAQYLDNLKELQNFISKVQKQSDDVFWKITDAYLKFLNKEYKESTDILAEINTNNPEYQQQIVRMKMLNDIVSQPKIDAAFEEHIMKTYPDLFQEKPSTSEDTYDYTAYYPSTADFIRDILANRYYIQGEDAKSYLMSHPLSFLQYTPNITLAKSLEAFFKKKDKSTLEREVIAKNIDHIGNPESFFNLIYGDQEMRLGHFEKAKTYYEKVKDFKGIHRNDYYDASEYPTSKTDEYDGFHNISSLVFGHNVWVSYDSPETISMKSENFSFPFIKDKMNKLELSQVLITLQQLAKGKDLTASQANQLIGNLMYNTSILGYYRHIFVMDMNNSYGGKFLFQAKEEQPLENRFYYKDFTQSYITPDDFDIAIKYYQNALRLTSDKEQQARIVFQMASAEQGKYYQWEAKENDNLNYDDPEWLAKREQLDAKLQQTKQQQYKTYFSLLKNQYSHTQTAKELMGNCSYFDYFMKK